MKKFMLLFLVLVFSALLPSSATADFKRTKVAVLDFQLKGQGHDIADMGKIVAEWLINALVKDGRFEVIDRGQNQRQKTGRVAGGKGCNFRLCNETSRFYGGQCQDN
jgi:curli biogenesis system outer membrane secretion channel CsgG